jgi:glutathione S-transferase
MQTIFHVTADTDWRAAQASGAYQLSTRGRSLEDEGFIHLSYANQVARVANAIYRGVPGLVLLVVDLERVTAPVREENLDGGDERFPHMYGPLNLDAVIEVLPFEPATDGTFTLPERRRT